MLIPGQISGAGSVRAPDGISSVNFSVSVQFASEDADALPGSTFYFFTFGPGLPSLYIKGVVKHVHINPAYDDAFLLCEGKDKDGRTVAVSMYLHKAQGIGRPQPYGAMALACTGATDFQTAGYPAELALYSGAIAIRHPF